MRSAPTQDSTVQPAKLHRYEGSGEPYFLLNDISEAEAGVRMKTNLLSIVVYYFISVPVINSCGVLHAAM